MSDHSRRSFLKRASVGAAAAGAAVAVPSMTSAQAAPEKEEAGPAHTGPFAVWVKNARTGEIAVLVDEREVTHQDKALARKLAKIAARA